MGEKEWRNDEATHQLALFLVWLQPTVFPFCSHQRVCCLLAAWPDSFCNTPIQILRCKCCSSNRHAMTRYDQFQKFGFGIYLIESPTYYVEHGKQDNEVQHSLQKMLWPRFTCKNSQVPAERPVLPLSFSDASLRVESHSNSSCLQQKC